MNIVNKVTFRHLKQNKRRTLVTIIGTIISVAMVTAVATLGMSFMDLFQRETMDRNGEWHVAYHEVDKAQLEVIKAEDNTEAVSLSRDRGYAWLEGSPANRYKPYLFVKDLDEEGFERFSVNVKEGRLPQTENEIVISEEIAKNAQVSYQIGDELTLEIGERFAEGQASEQLLSQTTSLVMNEEGENVETLINQEERSYTIVGVIESPHWEPSWSPGYTVISYVDPASVTEADPVDASVVLADVSNALFAEAEALAQAHNISNVSYHSELLRYYGVTDQDNLHRTLYSLLGIIIAVIVIGSVALIFNAFAISVSERSRHLGMLSSVGATKRQKRNSVFFEGFLIGLVSIPLGLLAGVVGIGITFFFINGVLQEALYLGNGLRLVVTPGSLLTAAGISVATIFISTYIPALRASRISAIDAIRQSQDVKLSGKAVKTSFLIRNVFGVEADIGLKNLKRHKRRYQVTVFSLVISIVLFLTVAFFTDSLVKSVDMSQDGVDFDIRVQQTQETEESRQLLDEIPSLGDVTNYTLGKEIYLSAMVDETKIAEELKQIPDQLEEGEYRYAMNVIALDEPSLTAYAEQVGIDPEQLMEEGNLKAIAVDTISYTDYDEGKFVETKAIQTAVGETFDLFYEEWIGDQAEKIDAISVEVLALTDEQPMGAVMNGLGSLNIVVSEQVFDGLTDEFTNMPMTTTLHLQTSDPATTQEEIDELGGSSFYVYNVHQMRQQEQQMVLIMRVFTYGFITLITLISVANIFNTISTSIALRKREFAMLKSIGMTPKSFNKMINYESIFYGVKALLYGLPLSILVMYLIHRSVNHTFAYDFSLPWLSMLYVVIAVFAIVGAAMLYSIAKIRKENIIDTLKQENI
ncbi:ABC transporter permease [Halalkalibacter oceani]|uniref:ABC transporter permease n=1 Tax=Halalkalibacter oceani TaxID=1653776 RepID=A0A9X2DSQ7_9BACI|nr:ABC transporter permease [Halalkalibacter oceani]MCM3714762.1 ABC transporter permease [Halalkalibacter oceani]